ATVALAAILDRHLRLGQIIEFAPPVTDGPITFSLPAGWKTWTRQAEGDGSAYVATASTAGVDRTLTISSQRIPHLMPPAEYILRALPVSGDLSRDDFKSLSIDGWPAQNIRWAAQSVTLKAEAEVKFSTTTAVVLPGDLAVMIRFDKDKDTPFDAGDARIYQQFSDSIHISAARPTDSGSLQLGKNISVSVPSDLQLYPQSDPLRGDRFAAAIADDGGWVGADFIPVAVPEHQP